MTQINGLEKLKKIDTLQVEDLDYGDYFYFVDDTSAIYLKNDNYTAVKISTGEILDSEDLDDIRMPVKRLAVEINILNIY